MTAVRTRGCTNASGRAGERTFARARRSAASSATSGSTSARLAASRSSAPSPSRATALASVVAGSGRRPSLTSTARATASGRSSAIRSGLSAPLPEGDVFSSPSSSPSRKGLPPVARWQALHSSSLISRARFFRTRCEAAARLNGPGLRRQVARPAANAPSASSSDAASPVRLVSATSKGTPSRRGATNASQRSDADPHGGRHRR